VTGDGEEVDTVLTALDYCNRRYCSTEVVGLLKGYGAKTAVELNLNVDDFCLQKKE
jgi:hypothetical protein